MNSYVTERLVCIPGESEDVHIGFDALEKSIMKRDRITLHWKVNHVGGKHIELAYSRLAEGLAKAKLVKFQRIVRYYERIDAPHTNYAPVVGDLNFSLFLYCIVYSFHYYLVIEII